jgi:hypothetical protein
VNAARVLAPGRPPGTCPQSGRAAGQAERAALARRFALVAIERLDGRGDLDADGEA